MGISWICSKCKYEWTDMGGASEWMTNDRKVLCDGCVGKDPWHSPDTHCKEHVIKHDGFGCSECAKPIKGSIKIIYNGTR